MHSNFILIVITILCRSFLIWSVQYVEWSTNRFGSYKSMSPILIVPWIWSTWIYNKFLFYRIEIMEQIPLIPCKLFSRAKSAQWFYNIEICNSSSTTILVVLTVLCSYITYLLLIRLLDLYTYISLKLMLQLIICLMRGCIFLIFFQVATIAWLEADSVCGSHSVVIPLVLVLPYLFRFNQCLRQYKDTGEKTSLLNGKISLLL